MPVRRVVGSPLAGRVPLKPGHSRLYHLRDWERASRRRLAEFPFCAECQRNGRTEAATVTDHIIPHRGNLDLFWDAKNHQSLCESCHGVKSRSERDA